LNFVGGSLIVVRYYGSDCWQAVSERLFVLMCFCPWEWLDVKCYSRRHWTQLILESEGTGQNSGSCTGGIFVCRGSFGSVPEFLQ
jgi:hypothetical protein